MPSRKPSPSPTLVVLGDSLSDNGNLFRLIGVPSAPYWQGRSSNGPVYAEDLARALGAALVDYAYSFAEASDASPTELLNPATQRPYPINLSNQIDAYLALLGGKRAPAGTTVALNFGSNDYDFFLLLTPPEDVTPARIAGEIEAVTQSLASAVAQLTAAGVGRIALYTLPDFALTPNAAAEGPAVQALVHQIDVAHNAVLAEIAAAAPNVTLVDVFKLTEAFAADPLAFGFTAPLSTELLQVQAAPAPVYAPDEVAFWDGEHPTAAAHAAIAAFSEATLAAKSVMFLDGSRTDVRGADGGDFIFAEPLDPARSGLSGNYTIHAGNGDDVVYAGDGNVTVFGGSGADLLFAGKGDASLFGGPGTDVLETNSLGHNLLSGGEGSDALIANRGGTNTLIGGEGADLLVLKEIAGLDTRDGGFAFGQQWIDGGEGADTLRFIINDQDPVAERDFIAEFRKVEAAFDAARRRGCGSFTVDGLHVSGVEKLELQIDAASTDPATPYVITHTLALSDGAAPAVSPGLARELQTAQNWNLLTV